jgi:hypothetical protein
MFYIFKKCHNYRIAPFNPALFRLMFPDPLIRVEH